jgi:RNA polymerase sigma factor (sigma-70 family)
MERRYRREAALDEGRIREFLMTDYPAVVGGLSVVCGSRPAAEDAVQEALARAWERSERGERIESLKAWVTAVSLNLLRSRYRKMRAERRARQRTSGLGSLGGANEGVHPMRAIEDLVDIRRALAALPRRQREATVLRYYLDMDVAEVARTLGVSEGTVKTTLHRARRALADALGVPLGSGPGTGAGESPKEVNDGAEL